MCDSTQPPAPTQTPSTPPTPSSSNGRKWLRRAGKPGKLLANIADWSESPAPATGGYGKVIRRCRNVGGVAGLLLWVCVAIPLIGSLVRLSNEASTRSTTREWVLVIVILPLAATLFGMVAGVAGACMLAPKSYLESESASHWRSRIGTESIPTARVACGVALLAMLGLAALLILFAVSVTTAPVM